MPGFASNLAGVLAVLLFLHHCSVPALSQRSRSRPASPWKTLSGEQPAIIAKGGFSGLFPDSSLAAYSSVAGSSLEGTIYWCDVQLTKDGVGICLPDINMSNCTDISGSALPKTNATINGVDINGWFPPDFTFKQLANVLLIQGIFSRSARFDSSYAITPVDALGMAPLNGSAIWLNIEHDSFYKKHNLSMQDFLSSTSRSMAIDYVSSPEVAFLVNVGPNFRRSKTKFVFRFLEAHLTEPSTKQTYGSLLKNLTFVKTFASGILVPKDYIWPVTASLFLQEPKTIVSDAHKIGLEVYASAFANDVMIAYDYSYNPISEYLSFVDNKDNFSIDGVLTDYPVTASEAIGCFSHLTNNTLGTGDKPLIISHNGASGTFPGCTDLAYKKAVDDGADVIDCPVQVTKDGILICQSSMNLLETTTVTQSRFATLMSTIPTIQSGPGIFTFNLTWEDIQSLKPQISSPFFNQYKLRRNAANTNAGKFMTLSDFLEFAKDKPSQIMIIVENAAFIAENIGFDIIGSVVKSLDDAGYKNETEPRVIIQSANSSVLVDFKQKTNYKLMYKIDEAVDDADSSSIKDIKFFAHSVAVTRKSIFPVSDLFIIKQTNLVKTLQSANISVYVYLLRNEFVSIPWDFFGDPIVEIHNYVAGAGVDGVITEDPSSASSYKKNTCLDGRGYKLVLTEPGGLVGAMIPSAVPPTLSPLPSLTAADVSEPPLPPLKANTTSAEAPSTARNDQEHILPSLLISFAMIVGSFLLIQ